MSFQSKVSIEAPSAALERKKSIFGGTSGIGRPPGQGEERRRSIRPSAEDIRSAQIQQMFEEMTPSEREEYKADVEISNAIRKAVMSSTSVYKAMNAVDAIRERLAKAQLASDELKEIEQSAHAALAHSHESTEKAKSAIVKKRLKGVEQGHEKNAELRTRERETADEAVAVVQREVDAASSGVDVAEAARQEAESAVAELAAEVDAKEEAREQRFAAAQRSASPTGQEASKHAYEDEASPLEAVEAATKKGAFYSSYVSLTDREERKLQALRAIALVVEPLSPVTPPDGKVKTPPKPVSRVEGRILANTKSSRSKLMGHPAVVPETPFLAPRSVGRGRSPTRSKKGKKKKKEKKRRGNSRVKVKV